MTNMKSDGTPWKEGSSASSSAKGLTILSKISEVWKLDPLSHSDVFEDMVLIYRQM